MDFGSPGSVFVSLTIGTVGFACFSYGGKQRRLPHTVIGIALMVFPYFVKGIASMLGIAGGLVGLLALAVRSGL